jgi:IS4 transposase
MIDLSTLRCEQALITSPEDGETLTRFEVEQGDVIMADRGLAHRRGIRYVVDHEGDVVVRMNLVSIPLESSEAEVFELLPRLRELDIGEARDWPVYVRDEQGTLPVRVCALKKSKEQTEKAQAKLRRRASKKGHALQADTLEAAGYVVVLTTLKELSANALLELYRHRWQIELAFKRLKSLLHLGHLKKTDPEGAKAWLQGKLLVAMLIEVLIAVGERFSPWGYFLRPASKTPLPLA